jgi:hypothetical protein
MMQLWTVVNMTDSKVHVEQHSNLAGELVIL